MATIPLQPGAAPAKRDIASNIRDIKTAHHRLEALLWALEENGPDLIVDFDAAVVGRVISLIDMARGEAKRIAELLELADPMSDGEA